MNKRIYLSSPTMHGLEMKYIQEAFDTNWVAPLGKNVDEFEKEMAAYVGVKHAAALVSGTSALLVTAVLVRIKLGSPVIFKQKRPGLHEKIFVGNTLRLSY